MKRTPLVQVGLVFCAAVLGLIMAELLGKVLQVRTGQASLNEYAARLQQTAVQVGDQAETVIRAVAADHLNFCSPEEIAQLRRQVYNNSQISDIGRIADGKLVCSSALGRLPEPIAMPVPDTELGGLKVYAWTPIMIAPKTTGFIVQSRGVDVVLNPHSFDGLKDPSRTYAAFLVDAKSGKLFQAFGEKMGITPAEILAGAELERGGIFYRPLCARKSRVCVVAAESRAVTLAKTERVRDVVLLMLACALDVLVLIAILMYRKHSSQARQLKRALRRDALNLVYQPIMNVETGAMTGAEALLRWRNENGVDVPPDVFIALAEEEGFVTEITRKVLRSAVRELRGRLLEGGFRVSVNVTAQDLMDETFVPFLKAELAAAGVKPCAVGLEITERSTTNHKVAIERIAELRREGFRVFIDDFGTGYSSLAYLRDLGVDGIKIDRAFTATVGTDAITESIIPHILQIAELLNLAVVAEGIETEAQAEYLRSRGKGILGQGWFYSKAVPAGQLRQVAGHREETYDFIT